MWAFVVAVGVLMGLWMAMSPHLLRFALAGRADSVRLAGLVGLTGVGVIACVCLSWFVLPGSAISLTWTREMLFSAREYSIILVLLVAGMGFWRTHGLLFPPVRVKAAAKIPISTPKKKRRP